MVTTPLIHTEKLLIFLRSSETLRLCSSFNFVLFVLNFEEKYITHIFRQRCKIAEEAARKVLCDELVEEAQLHQVNVKCVRYFDELRQSAIFQLLIEQRADFHQDLVKNMIAFFLIQKQPQSAHE